MSANHSGSRPSSEPRLLVVQCEDEFRIRLRYDDGTEGSIDLSSEIRKGGVFAALEDPAVFASVRIGEFGQVEWPNGVDLCPDALYLRLAKQTPRELFPDLTQQPADA